MVLNTVLIVGTISKCAFFLLPELRHRLREEAGFSVTPYAARRAGTKAYMNTGLLRRPIYIKKNYSWCKCL